MDRVRELLRAAPAVHADETPARAAGGTRYLYLACTYLTHMHTGDRSAESIDAGQVLPGYSGVIVRDGYAGYGHLTDALHAWWGAHLLRDLNAVRLPAKNATALTVPVKLPVASSPCRSPRTSAPTAPTAPAQARAT